MTISPLNAETRLKRLKMKSLHLFSEERPAPMTCVDANTVAQKGPVGIIDEKKIEHAHASSSHHQQVSQVRNTKPPQTNVALAHINEV